MYLVYFSEMLVSKDYTTVPQPRRSAYSFSNFEMPFSSWKKKKKVFTWGETESTSYVGHCLAYYTSPEWQMIVEHSVEWELAGETEVLGENPT
jgi:hypothetical protein